MESRATFKTLEVLHLNKAGEKNETQGIVFFFKLLFSIFSPVRFTLRMGKGLFLRKSVRN